MSTAAHAWWEATVQVPAPLADDAAALVIHHGARGVELQTAEDPLPRFADAPIPTADPPPPDHARLICSYSAPADAGVVERSVRGALAELGLGSAPVRVVLRRDQDWAEHWKRYFKPMRLGPTLWVVPSWERGASLPHDALPIELDPGMAFGTGQHATTALCAGALEEWVRERADGSLSMLDVGCGSGILAIAAAKLGAEPVVAIDNDPAAVKATAENVERNGVEVAVSGEDVAQIPGHFDLVVANILASVLIDLAPALIERVGPEGRLMLSGVLYHQRDEVLEAMTTSAEQLGRELRLVNMSHRGPWVVLELEG